MKAKNHFEKGIILAGGSGTRLYPITRAVSKQLLPIYEQAHDLLPAVGAHAGGDSRRAAHLDSRRHRQLQTGAGGRQPGRDQYRYAVQPHPGGLAQAFLIGREFVGLLTTWR